MPRQNGTQLWIDGVRESAGKVGRLFGRSRFEAEMDDELQFHVEMQIEQLVQEGHSPEEARRRALVDFGGLEQTREVCREAAGIRLMHDFIQDLRYAVRVLVRSPGFTIVAVVTLALGIGANTAVFSVVNTLILQPLPFSEPGRIVMLWEENPESGLEKEQVARADVIDWREKCTTFESFAVITNRTATSRNFLLKIDEDVQRIRGRHVSSHLFDVLGVAPHLGEALSPEDDEPGGPRRAVISHELWQLAFNGDPEVLGQQMDIDRGEPFEIIGVMPPGVRFPPDAEFWLSLSGFGNERYQNSTKQYHGGHWFWALGRLKDGVTVEQANEDLNLIQRQIYEAPENAAAQRVASQVIVVPLLAQFNGETTRSALLFLLGAVGFVLLIACANVANLLLARATARRREMAIRAALGAGRFRVIRQLLTESLLLSSLGAVLAVFVALWGIGLLEFVRTDSTYLGVRELRFDRIDAVSIDFRVLAFTVGVSALTGVLFGLIPAVQASKLNVNSALKEDSRSGTPGKATQLFRSGLLVAEVALAITLLAGAGLALRGFTEMTSIDPGMHPEGVLSAEFDVDMADQAYGTVGEDTWHELTRRLESVPGVKSVAMFGESPLIMSGWPETVRFLDGDRAGMSGSELPEVKVRLVSSGAFKTIGVPLTAGRDFDDGTDRSTRPLVVMVNQTFVDKFYPDQDPIGQRFQMRGVPQWEREIVGVVGSVRNYSTDSVNQPEFYMPFDMGRLFGPEVGPVVVISVTGEPDETIPAMRHAVNGSEPSQEVLVRYADLEKVLNNSASQERFQTLLLGCFSGIALLLAIVGVYGVMSYSTVQRFQEMGIRLALGAQPRQILTSIAGHGIRLCTIGVVIGIGCAIGLAKLMSHLVFGLDDFDAITLGAVAVILLVAGTAASLIPAWRAMRIDPLNALRHE